MRPSVSLVADTICRTAEIGLAFAGAAGAGTFTITDAAALVALEGGTAPTAPSPGNCVMTLSADWLTCWSWGFRLACTFVSTDLPAPINNV